jgi:hypothetical protein
VLAGCGVATAAACSFLLGYTGLLGVERDDSPARPAQAGLRADANPKPIAKPMQEPPTSGTRQDLAAATAAPALAWPMWEYRLAEPVPARAQPLTPVNWRLVGAALIDGRWKLIVNRQGSAVPEYHEAGARLPGGYVIKEITQEDVTLMVGKRELVLAYIGSR